MTADPLAQRVADLEQELARRDSAESTQPITFRIRKGTLARVRAYQREHGLKTDGEALRALIEAGLSTPAAARGEG